MDFDRETSAERLEGLFSAIDQSSETSFRLDLFGGCAMTLHDWKKATKDVDAVLMGEPDHEKLRAAFASVGLVPADGYDLGGPLDPHTMFESDDTWLDLFLPERIMGGLVWSEALAARCAPWFQGRRVDVRVADGSVVFLLKAVTGRWRRDPARDLPDMQLLVGRGLVDFTWVDREWRRQCLALDSPTELVETADEAVRLLAARGLRIPWDPAAGFRDVA